MEHIDVAARREVTMGPVRTIFVTIPYTADGDGCPHSGTPSAWQRSARTAATGTADTPGDQAATAAPTLAKPTLDPWRVCLTPEDRWVPDAQVIECMSRECRNTFTMFTRKHHCRICGKVFCVACCSHTVKVPTHLVQYQQMLRQSHKRRYGSAPQAPLAPGDPLKSHAEHGDRGAELDSVSAEVNRSCLLREEQRALSMLVDEISDDCLVPSSRSSFALRGRLSLASGVPQMAASVAAAGSLDRTSSREGTPPREGGVTAPVIDKAGNLEGLMVGEGSGISSGNGNCDLSSSSIAPSGSPRGNPPLSLYSALVPSTPSSSSVETVRVCSACFYESQLVVSRRVGNGEPRRKCRGEFKMLQWKLLVNILSFLPIHALLEVSRVSSDLYFMSRDNVIWLQLNMARWVEENEHLSSNVAKKLLRNAKMRKRFGNLRSDRTGKSIAPVSNGNLNVERAAANRVISLHASYNFTQFLDFSRRQELSRCQGLSSFSAAARMLFSSPVKICIIGPPNIGKTAMLRQFLGRAVCASGNSRSTSSSFSKLPAAYGSGTSAAVSPLTKLGGAFPGGISFGNSSAEVGEENVAPGPTIGFVRYRKQVRLAGGIHTDATFEIYDVSGLERYEELRRFLASQCHCIGLCYNAHRKVTMVEAAVLMAGVESSLGPQPVVVCGLVMDLQQPREVIEAEAEGITARGAGSVQCAVSTGCEELFQKLVQALLDRIVLGTASPNTTATPSATPPSGNVYEPSTRRPPRLFEPAVPAKVIAANRTVAQNLLRLSLEKSALDVLLEPK